MCGIGGIFAYSDYVGPVELSLLKVISKSMSSRGPDHANEWISKDKKIGLVHRRLSIIDLSSEANQPMEDLQSGNEIIFNGEIYNYKELKIDLESKGHIFHTNSDTEVILKLYSVYGEKMLSKLRGMFAIAIWNNTDKSIFLARDHFGIKPLYYSDTGKKLYFASQVKSLISTNKCGNSIDPAGHVGFFLWGHVPEPHTLYSDISALPPGTYMKIQKGGKKIIKKFFHIKEEFFENYSANHFKNASTGDILEELYSTLEDTISAHLIADVPVGLFLSAGLDSSAILSLMSKLNNSQNDKSQINTFTLGFDEFKSTNDDETGLAQVLATKYNTNHYNCNITKNHFLENLSNMITSMDQPTIDGVNTYFVSKAAHSKGMKVAISGLGGDELFGGYSSFNEIPNLVNSIGFMKNIPMIGKGFRVVSSKFLKYFTSPKYAGLFEYGTNYGGAYLLRRGLFMPWELPQILDPEIVKEGWSQLNAIQDLNATCSGIRNPISKVSALEHSHYMKNRLLRDADWASMAHSLEVRIPLVDIYLFRKVISLRNSGRVISKSELANCLGSSFPEIIKSRKKTGFSIPVSKWMSESDIPRINNNYKGMKLWAKFVYDALQ